MLARGKKMQKTAIIPAEFEAGAARLKASPGLLSGDFLFLTGVTGGNQTGEMPQDPEEQIRNVFEKIGRVLQEAGLTYGALVEMTSYHLGLRTHFELFSSLRANYVEQPYPAWTAVEVAGLRREGAIVEVRAIATTR